MVRVKYGLADVSLIKIPAKCQGLDENNKCIYHGTNEKPVICRKFTESSNDEDYWIPPTCLMCKRKK